MSASQAATVLKGSSYINFYPRWENLTKYINTGRSQKQVQKHLCGLSQENVHLFTTISSSIKRSPYLFCLPHRIVYLLPKLKGQWIFKNLRTVGSYKDNKR